MHTFARFAFVSAALFAWVTVPSTIGACIPQDGDPTPDVGDVWAPGIAYPTARAANARGFVVRRGQIHAHSIFSHDACDGEPVKDGENDTSCLRDFRDAICKTRQDFVMLTDHPERFAENEFPEVLLFDRAFGDDYGDTLVERDGLPAYNRALCPEDVGPVDFETLILAGEESSAMMPVGISGHMADTVEARKDFYGTLSLETTDALHENGAVVLMAHPEDHTLEELTHPGLDGFEMFNLHALFFAHLVEALDLMIAFSEGDTGLPHPDLAAMRLFEQDPIYLERWSSVLATGKRPSMTFGTDCHQNVLPGEAPDGERLDSYRRMMAWMSNHLLVDPGEDGVVDDIELKEALKSGRLFGAFDYLGAPLGFDFRAEAGARVVEMGGEISLADAPVLRVTPPTVQNRDPGTAAPDLHTVLYRATDEGGWAIVDESRGTAAIRFSPETPGAYRADVFTVPFHVEEHLNADAPILLRDARIWVMSNAIYVVD